jgi:3-(3-hydroxy-phenyl)propionate hydroxylase
VTVKVADDNRARRCDVVVVGLGPVGAVAANLLGLSGIDAIAVDALPSVWSTPRAIGMDHEVMRILQSIGVADAMAPHMDAYRPSEYRAADGRLLRRFDTLPEPYPLAWPPNIVFVQPELERVLRERLADHRSIDVRLGQKVVAATLSADESRLTVQGAAGAPYDINARYVLACDGANSLLREAGRLSLEDLQFDEPWLVVDVLLQADVELPEVNIQFCDPARPMTYVRGPGRLRRWEIMLLPGEDPARVVHEDILWSLLERWLKPTQATIWRAACYRFHALVAQRWRRHNLFLLGDAAHQTPPFIAQGMSQGVRDAANIVWKLAAVLDGRAGPAALETYEVERRPNVRSVIETTKRLGELICERDPVRAAARDRRMLDEMATGAGRLIRQSLLPPLSEGLLHRIPNGELSVGAGEPALQPWLKVGGLERRADDVTGVGFRLFLSQGAARGTALERCAERLQLAVFELANPNDAGRDNALHEVHGLWAEWLALRGATAVLVRPDHLVYGSAMGTDSGLVLAQALERDLKAEHRDGAARAGATQVASSSG